MRFVWRLIKWAVLALLLGVILLLAPVGYVELACRGTDTGSDVPSQIAPAHHRLEARTFLTYPEWHIVHAYDDYAKVIETGDPHDYRFMRGIAGFWSSLCPLSRQAASHGGFDWPTKQTIYTIGVSFSAELALKALYEESLGRLVTIIRGSARAPLDDVSARQAADYAQFLQQTPWYLWDFERDISQLSQARTGALRDRERRLALGLEFGAKAKYAKVIEAAVANLGADALRLRMVVTGLRPSDVSAYAGITLVAQSGSYLEIETPRYRRLTGVVAQLARDGVDFVEMAGNDDIMITALSPHQYPAALHSFARQGYGDRRHLIALKVSDLGARLRGLAAEGLTLEHIHDY